MALYWQLKSVPELRKLRASRRAEVYQVALKQALQEPMCRWVNRIVNMMCIAAGLAAFSWFLLRHLFHTDTWDWYGPIALFATALMIVTRPWMIQRTRPYIREYLSSGV